MAYTTHEVACLLVIAALLSAMGFILSRAALRCKWRSGAARVAELIQRSVRCGGAAQPDSVGRRVVQEKSRLRKRIFEALASSSAVLGALSLVPVAWAILNKDTRWTSPVQDYAALLFPSVCGLIHYTRTAAHVAGLSEECVHDAAYAAVMMLIFAFAVGGGGLEERGFFLTMMTCVPARAGWSIAYGKMCAVVFWNTALVVAMTLTVYNRIGEEAEVHAQFVYQFSMVDLFTSSCTIFATVFGDMALWLHAQRVVQIQNLSGESCAMNDLLCLMSDVVVELDQELNIANAAPQLAAMFTKSPLGSLQGTQLQQFMAAEEDRQHFATVLLASADDVVGNQAGALHSTMQDSLGNRIKVEIFYSRSQGFDGCKRYFVGIREFGDGVAELKQFPAGQGQKDAQLRAPASTRSGTRPGQPRRESPRPGGAKLKGTCEAQQTVPPAETCGLPSDASDHEVSSSVSSVVGLVIPQLLPTKDKAKDVAVLDTLLAWNTHVAATTCCSFHATLLDARRSMRRLERHDCIPGWTPKGVAQCEDCGTLLPEIRKACLVCNGEALVFIAGPPEGKASL